MEKDLALIEALSSSDEFDRHFQDMIGSFFGGQHPRFCPAERVWNPPTDIFETTNSIQIKMELAGVREEDVEVKVSNNILIVRGKRVDEQDIKKDNFHLMEIHYGSFERVFGLPMTMEVSNVTASLKNGFLLITVPKDSRTRDIRIEIE